MTSIDAAAELRARTIETTSDERRRDFAQHLTPKETALLAVSMFSPTDKKITTLDMGAGTGILTIALMQRYGDQITSSDCIEVDPTLARVCESELRGVSHRVIVADALTETPDMEYERIILNPPYKKMAASDPRQPSLPVRSPNLYSVFVAVALTRLSDDGELVAIIPRSWTNGDYFTPFRKWALSGWSLDALHVYGSRKDVFKETNVLQETMIVRFSRRKQSSTIRVSRSAGRTGEIELEEHAASDLIVGDSRVVRISPPSGRIIETLASRGYCPSTGKVVDFRNRECIYMTYEEAASAASDPGDIYRLVYAGNMRTGELRHPADIGKGQWYRADDRRAFR